MSLNYGQDANLNTESLLNAHEKRVCADESRYFWRRRLEAIRPMLSLGIEDKQAKHCQVSYKYDSKFIEVDDLLNSQICAYNNKPPS